MPVAEGVTEDVGVVDTMRLAEELGVSVATGVLESECVSVTLGERVT